MSFDATLRTVEHLHLKRNVMNRMSAAMILHAQTYTHSVGRVTYRRYLLFLRLLVLTS